MNVRNFSVNFALAAWIGHLLRKNCLISHVIKGKKEERMEVTGRRERRRRQLLNAFEKQAGTVN
jgi:hypothetical protein